MRNLAIATLIFALAQGGCAHTQASTPEPTLITSPGPELEWTSIECPDGKIYRVGVAADDPAIRRKMSGSVCETGNECPRGTVPGPSDGGRPAWCVPPYCKKMRWEGKDRDNRAIWECPLDIRIIPDPPF